MYNPYKTKYKYRCIRCGKPKVSVDDTKITCNKCLDWKKAGVGQTDMFGGVVDK